jgi:hypothetical protein
LDRGLRSFDGRLDEPWPHLIRWRVDRDGHRRTPLAVGDQVGTRIRSSDFLIACAPAHEPRAHPDSIDDSCQPGHTRDLASECHMTSIGGCALPRKGTTSRPLGAPRDTPEPDTFLTIVMTGIGPNANPRQVMDSATVQVAPKGVRGCFHYVAGSTVVTKTSGAIQMRLPDGVLSAGGVDLPQVGVGPSEARVIEFGPKGSTSTSSC